MDITSIVNVAPPIALLFVLNAVGLGIKAIPQVPNWLIPLLLPLVGAVAYPFIGEYSDYAKAAKVPWLVMALYGWGIGWSAVGANQLLKQFRGRNDSAVDGG